MHSYETPEPITLNATLKYAELTVEATENKQATVVITPDDGNAEHPPVDVTFTGGVLTIKQEDKTADKSKGFLGMVATRLTEMAQKNAGVKVTVSLPLGSTLKSKLAVGSVKTIGDFASVSVDSGAGDIALSHCDEARVAIGAGEISIEHASQGKVTNGGGDIRIADCGDLEIKTGAGEITVDTCSGAQQIKTGAGSISVKTAVEGNLNCFTGVGSVTVGVPDGTACLLDIKANMGKATSELQPTDGPDEADHKLELTAKTGTGNVRIHRV